MKKIPLKNLSIQLFFISLQKNIIKYKTMKRHYTSVEQCEKLIELGLNPNTADMVYLKYADSNNTTPRFEGTAPMILMDVPINEIDCETLPCWSIGALLDLIPTDSEWHLCGNKSFDFSKNYGSFIESHWIENSKSYVDSCYNMVVWLLEHEYIKDEEVCEKK